MADPPRQPQPRCALYPGAVDHMTHPIDEESRRRLAGDGLRLDLVDTGDESLFRRWLEVEARGFHGGLQSPEALAESAVSMADRRTTAVFEPASGTPSPDIVGTVNSWPVELTVPGGHRVRAWAISGVTVAATHRRRGIARSLLEAELRTAHALSVPVATLTVSEATIYGRFGFSPAVRSVDLTIDTRRAKWIGGEPSGTIRFVSAEQLITDADAILDRVRGRVPGSVSTWPKFHERMFLSTPANAERGKKYRFVRYDDVDGIAQGYAMFQLTHDGEEFAAGVLEIEMLCSATVDAYSALWRFMLEMDLVVTVKAPLRSIDEPLLWQVADMRSVRSSGVRDHLWTRILDVEKALSAREFAAPTRILLDVTDDMGFATGSFTLEIDDLGVPTVTRVGADAPAPEHPVTAHLALPVTALSAIYLGGIRVATLVSAGVVREVVPGSSAVVDRAFGSDVTPWLGFWF